jgi:hypothetical protein
LADDADQILFQAEAGFVLKKFKNEAAFTTYMDALRTNVSLCAFETTAIGSNTGDDTMSRPTDDYGDDIVTVTGPVSSADELALYLKNGRYSESMSYTFKRYEFELAMLDTGDRTLVHLPYTHFSWFPFCLPLCFAYPTSCFVQWRRGTVLFDV